jgi:hypothetical protein
LIFILQRDISQVLVDVYFAKGDKPSVVLIWNLKGDKPQIFHIVVNYANCIVM